MKTFTRKLLMDESGAIEGLLYRLASNDSLRGLGIRRRERKTMQDIWNGRTVPDQLPGVYRDRRLLGLSMLHSADRALRKGLVADSVAKRVLHNMVDWYLADGYNGEFGTEFKVEHGVRPPWFIVVSPGKGCNLHCKGCYASSGARSPERLDWDVTDRIVSEARDLWKARFFVISGGEPMAYRSNGKGILDLAEKHDDSFFLVYTNGTLIDEDAARRMAGAGNITPAISVEGFEDQTDARRGKGVFQRILKGMGNLRQAGVPFGVSLTATCENCEDILSDEFLDLFFDEQGASYGWIFQYMPIGRSFTLKLLPTPEQRVWMLRRTWEVIKARKLFLVDFWNSGPAVSGCLAGGREGGYLYIDWNGKVMPCVFNPYSPVNILDVYENGGDLNDVWGAPFFEAIREWQREYASKHSNWLMPCPIRDHHRDFRRILAANEPDPEDKAALQAMMDPAYREGLIRYDEALAQVMDPIWEREYLGAGGNGNGQRLLGSRN